MTREELEGFHCAVEASIAILGGKYKAIIVWWLTESGIMRYSDIKRKIPQATAKMLSQQLRELEADEIISRKVYPVIPPKTRIHPDGTWQISRSNRQGDGQMGARILRPPRRYTSMRQARRLLVAASTAATLARAAPGKNVLRNRRTGR